METRRVFEAITGMIADYNEKAFQAVKVGDGYLYVPGYMSLQDFVRVLNDPCILTQTGNNTKEPAYLSLEEGLRGWNHDGSEHSGFIVINPIAREVVAIIDRKGKSSFDATDPNIEIMDGRWGGYKIIAINSKREKFEIETEDGVRGINIPVTVIYNRGSWIVMHRGEPIKITGVNKITTA